MSEEEKLVRENRILKTLLRKIIDRSDTCYVCEEMGQILFNCLCLNTQACIENMIRLQKTAEEKKEAENEGN